MLRHSYCTVGSIGWNHLLSISAVCSYNLNSVSAVNMWINFWLNDYIFLCFLFYDQFTVYVIQSLSLHSKFLHVLYIQDAVSLTLQFIVPGTGCPTQYTCVMFLTLSGTVACCTVPWNTVEARCLNMRELHRPVSMHFHQIHTNKGICLYKLYIYKSSAIKCVTVFKINNSNQNLTQHDLVMKVCRV